MTKKLEPYFAGIILAILFTILGIATIHDYGISWDAAFRMMRGQAYAHLYLDNKLMYGYPDRTSPVLIKPNDFVTRYRNSAWEGQIKRTDFPERPLPQVEYKTIQAETKSRTSFYESEDWNGNYAIHEGVGHLPFIDTLSAFSNHFFYQTLGALGDIESFQLIYILAAAIGVFVVTVFTFQITSSHSAALIAGFSLSLFPLFLGDSHINMKDPIQASFYAGAIWSFWNWLKTNQLRWFVIFTTFVSFALGVKWNIIFLPIVFGPWLLTILKTSELKRWFRVKKLLFYFGLMFLVCSLFMIVIWPDSWSDPIKSLVGVTGYYWQMGTSSNIQPDGFIGLLGINFYPVILVLTQTPEVILFFIACALSLVFIKPFKNDHLKSTVLVCLWVFEPLVRYSLPHVSTLLGLRQIMEILPGLAVLAGIGSWYLVEVTSNKFGARYKSFIGFALALTTCCLLLIPIVRLHPNENTYFNVFTGGLKGAVNNNLIDWTLTYGNIYKQAAIWLNKNAEANANIALLDGSNFALSPLWLRNDISFSPSHFSALDQKSEYFLVPLDSSTASIFAIRYPLTFLKPIHRIEIDGVPVMFIYKNSPEFVRDGYQKEKQVTEATVTPSTVYKQKILEVNLQNDSAITRLIISGADPKCLQAYVNDIFIFQSVEQISKKQISSDLVYPFPEAKVMADGQIEYFFPAEKSQYLSILLGQDSCFTNGKIRKVFALDN